ncbi:MAG: RHS repeat protein [Deltaproteobacteria bacterium]|nr:RHS repeat protein [Deltaproteobacteria bacterium]
MNKILIGTITDSSDAPITWTLDIAGRKYSGSGTWAFVFWNGTDANGVAVPSGTYTATLSAKPVDGSCSDSKSIQIEIENSCDLKANLTGPGSNLAFGAGGSYPITGSYITSSSQPVNWTLTLPDGSSKSGTGMPINSTWNGNNANGALAVPGSYEAVLTVTSSVVNTCAATQKLPIRVSEAPPGQCGLYVTFGSSAHVASGNLSHTQELFSTKGGVLPAGVTLYHNSLDPFNGSLGRGWSHNYDLSLKEFSDGSVLISEGNWKYRYYTLSNGAYIAQPGNYDVLTKNGDNTFTLTQKDGTVYRFGTQPVTTEGGSSTVTPPAGDGGASQGGDTTRGTELNTRDEAPPRDGERREEPAPDPREEPPPIVPTPIYPVAEGKIVSITDRNGNTVTFAYNNGNLATVTDPAGRVVSLAYDAANHLTSVTDPAGNSYSFSVVDNTLASVIQPDGGQWRYSYDSNAYMLTKADPVGNVTSYAYDDRRRVVSSTDPEGRTRNIAYPQTSDTVKSTTFTEKDGGVWSYSYDTQKGYLLSKTDPQGGVTSYAYDAAGNRTSTTNPDGTTTTSTYDAAGNMTSTTDALGQTTSYSYNAFGQVTGITDAHGGTTAYTYDAKGNMTSVSDPAGVTTTYAFDAKGNVANVTNAAGQATSFTYDAKGNLAAVTDPIGATTSYAYDAAGNVISITDSKGAVTQFVYDARNRLIKTIDPQGNITSYTYDANGNKLSETDANGNTTTFEYNSRNQLIKTIDALGSATTYAYGGSACPSCGSGADKLTAITDANGNITSYLYDQLGRSVKEADPLGNSIAYAYDARNNPVSKTDANGNTINYSYDANGRLLKKSYPDSTEETFTYDAKGNLLTATNKNISYTFAYDAAGRMLSAADSTGKVISYEYDLLGNKTKMISPEGKSISYTYDKANRLSSIINGGTFTFGYDTKGQRSSLSYPNGDTATYVYDKQGRLTSLVRKNAAGTVISSNSYTLDKVGNRQTNTSQDRTSSYSYDAIYRLTQALTNTPGYSTNTKATKGTANAVEQQREFFTYDPVGNRLTSAKNRSYSYGPANQLVSENGTTYSYDKNGNLVQKATSDGITIFAWDFDNRLVKVTTSSSAVEYAYDPFGRRIEKKVTESGTTTTTRFFYDGQAILFNYDEAGAIGNSYIHGPNIDEPLAVTAGKDKYYYHADGLGSIIALTDAAGKVVQNYEYDSFGNLKDQKNRVKQPFTYTGREWDKETGLYYYRARYYDPMDGRLVSRDPIGFKCRAPW